MVAVARTQRLGDEVRQGHRERADLVERQPDLGWNATGASEAKDHCVAVRCDFAGRQRLRFDFHAGPGSYRYIFMNIARTAKGRPAPRLCSFACLDAAQLLSSVRPGNVKNDK